MAAAPVGTQLLVSVRDVSELRVAAAAAVDIIDLKDPEQGALGAVSESVVSLCLAETAPASLSVVVGEFDGTPSASLKHRLDAMVGRGLGFLKIGVNLSEIDLGSARGATLAASPAWLPSLGALLAAPVGAGERVVLVFYAEAPPPVECFANLALAGVTGVMLDTRDKGTGSLLQRLCPSTLVDVISAARAARLKVGLAGRLALSDLPTVLRLQPDVIGMRGGLCRRSVRTAALSPERIAEAQRLLGRRTVGVPLEALVETDSEEGSHGAVA